MVTMIVASLGKTLLLLALLLVSLPLRRSSLGADLFFVVRGSGAVRLRFQFVFFFVSRVVFNPDAATLSIGSSTRRKWEAKGCRQEVDIRTTPAACLAEETHSSVTQNKHEKAKEVAIFVYSVKKQF